MMTTLTALRESLPNFPDDVLADWLLPYAATEGWPPADRPNAEPQGRWRLLLRKRPLSYWSSLKWELTTRHLSIHQLHPENQKIMQHMVLGAVTGQANLYSNSIHDLNQRFFSIVEYLQAHGRLPRPPALFCELDGLTVLDGNHRLAAYFYCYGYFTLDPGIKLLVGTEEHQNYWVATEIP